MIEGEWTEVEEMGVIKRFLLIQDGTENMIIVFITDKVVFFSSRIRLIS